MRPQSQSTENSSMMILSTPSVESVCWLINEGYDMLSNKELEAVAQKMESIVSCQHVENEHVLKEYVCLLCMIWLKLKPLNSEEISMQELDDMITRVTETGVYNEDKILTPAIMAYITTMGYDRQPRYPRVVGIVVGSIIRRFVRQYMELKTYTCEGRLESEGKRLRLILNTLSKKCTYERSGDIYIHKLLRSKLYAYWNVYLAERETPYDAISKQYTDEANDLVRPFIETDPDIQFQHVQWENTSDIDGFHFIVGLLREALDGCECKVLCNNEISQGCVLEEPYFFVLSENFDIGVGCVFGYGVKNKLYIAPKDRPHLMTILCFLNTFEDCKIPALVDFKTACMNPSQLSSSSPFYTICENLVQL